MKVTLLNLSSRKDAVRIMRTIGVTGHGIRIMAPKTRFFTFKIEGISSFTANIIKQHMLSCGADAALSRSALTKTVTTSCLVFGTAYQISVLIKKLRYQPFESKEVALNLSRCIKETAFHAPFSFTARDKKIVLRKPCVCGILNVTPDSFSGDGILAGTEAASGRFIPKILEKARAMIKEGAKIIDIGGESTRPYSKAVSEKEEIQRIIPAISAVRKRFPRICISADTYKYTVAREALRHGADMINDITALIHSPRIRSLLKHQKAGVVLMHMRGNPRTMQKDPLYADVVEEIYSFLAERVSWCIRGGIPKERIMIDPGIGFGKTVAHNLCILRGLSRFKEIGVPVFIGLSRKSFIGSLLKKKTGERLAGTLGATTAACSRGANVVRVHDVGQTVQALRLAGEIMDFHKTVPYGIIEKKIDVMKRQSCR